MFFIVHCIKFSMLNNQLNWKIWIHFTLLLTLDLFVILDIEEEFVFLNRRAL